MGRFLTAAPTAVAAAVAGLPWASARGRMEPFGSMRFRLFGHESGSGDSVTVQWVCPPGVTLVRVRCTGSGSVFGTPGAGPTSSFGGLISATGGGAVPGSTGGTGGVGIGGDYRANGGKGSDTPSWSGSGSAYAGGAGGAAGSVLGNGGDATPGGQIGGTPGASGTPANPAAGDAFLMGVISLYARFPGESFPNLGVPYTGVPGAAGPGQGGAATVAAGWSAGGSGGQVSTQGFWSSPGAQAQPYTGGGRTGMQGPGGGGGGFAMGEIPVVPGQSYPITYGGNGSVVVEY
jgi:hypothetical protein